MCVCWKEKFQLFLDRQEAWRQSKFRKCQKKISDDDSVFLAQTILTYAIIKLKIDNFQCHNSHLSISLHDATHHLCYFCFIVHVSIWLRYIREKCVPRCVETTIAPYQFSITLLTCSELRKKHFFFLFWFYFHFDKRAMNDMNTPKSKR